LGPLVVTGYFIALWRTYLAPIDSNSPLPFGPPGAKWVFYSWFLVGVIGLNLSLYGMEGVEAGMLMEPAWRLRDGMRLMMHADKSWSGPGGWMKMIKWNWKIVRKGGRFQPPARLWFVLALPSIFVFTAYPLSGLTMEMTQGYLHGKRAGAGPTVKGFSYANFNERSIGDAYAGAAITWKNALDARILGQGIVYTPKGYDRSQKTFLNKLPTILPKTDGATRMFLTAQAENPIEGNSWGLLLQYNCSIVDKVDDLRILNNRNSSVKFNSLGYAGFHFEDGSLEIQVMNQTNQPAWVNNMFGVIEMGLEVWPNRTTSDRLTSQNPNAQLAKMNSGYFTPAKNITGDYPGIDQEGLFEVLLFQSLLNTSYGTVAKGPQYNFSVDHNITSLYGAYNYADFFQDQFPDPPNSTAPKLSFPMTAIGVQCKASSNVGTADIDGITSTYSNFVRTDTPINQQINRKANRFDASVPVTVMQGPGQEWLSSLFSSVAAPPPFYASTTDDPNDSDQAYGYDVQLSYLQAEQLRQSMLRAYAAYAVQLMYNGGQGFTSYDGSHISFQNPNITEFVSGTVISQGVMPAAIPIILFLAWALVGSVLGVVYGFRRRWSAILDGYAMFRLGADLPDDVKKRFNDHSNTLEVDECHGLSGVPGLVGDVKPEMWLGRIGLVEGSVANKGKMYE
jgi:hypothetical protein